AAVQRQPPLDFIDMVTTMKRLLLYLALMHFTTSLGSAQLSAEQPSNLSDEAVVFLGGIEMRLGMPKAAILGALEDKYQLTNAGEDSWFIMEKGDPPSKVIGGIAFKEGRLSWISRDWSNFEKATALDFARDFFSLLANLSEEGKSVALIHTSTVRQPGLTLRPSLPGTKNRDYNSRKSRARK
ncbi:MAG TPA: hypothetical protein VKM72_32500, partial [Thermoanaerobaculia bacterium]|nr:hypothetical protein [Thermoanaerobaculia bacterium]